MGRVSDPLVILGLHRSEESTITPSTPTMTIFFTVTNDSASYHVTLTNDFGSATSTPALLTVLAPVKITSLPASTSVLLGSPATFSVTVTGSVPAYQWYFNGTDRKSTRLNSSHRT